LYGAAYSVFVENRQVMSSVIFSKRATVQGEFK
jgi:hypothetical protein